MLSKNKIKFLNSLQNKKYRKQHQCFIAEGVKIVEELLQSSLICKEIYGTAEWKEPHPAIEKNYTEISEKELKRISQLQTPNQVLAVFEIPTLSSWTSTSENELILALDKINDPGNLGTIMRIADWFGIEHVICSPESVDAFNPKTVQATMGAIARIKVHYSKLADLLEWAKEENIRVYGTYLKGKDIFKEKLQKPAIIVMGSESHGISEELEEFIPNRLTIPSYPAGNITSESLNISTATAIVCAEFRRQTG